VRGVNCFDFAEGGRIRLREGINPQALLDKKLRLLQHTFFDYDYFNKSFYITQRNQLPASSHAHSHPSR
jgi:hypothetical protein